MTSNLGSREIQSSALVDTPVKEMVLGILREHFKPEFLNRIDDIVVFKQLAKENIAQIIDVQLEKLRRNLADRGVSIELDESARELLVKEGYDPIYGARPLRRAIQTLVQNPLAVKLLNSEVVSGQTVRISADNGEMKFTSGAAKATA